MPQIFHHSTNALAKLTIYGAVFILVAALWGCWLGQRYYLCQARRNIHGAVHDIRRLHRMPARVAPSLSPGRLLINRTKAI